MKNLKLPTFNYGFMPTLKFGCGLASAIGEDLTSICGDKHVMVISDPGVIAAGLTDAVMASLNKQSVAVDLFDDVVATDLDVREMAHLP